MLMQAGQTYEDPTLQLKIHVHQSWKVVACVQNKQTNKQTNKVSNMIVKLEQKLDMQEIIIACLFGSIFIIFSRKCGLVNVD